MPNKLVRVPLPHDFMTHRDAWRTALQGMRDAAVESGDGANQSYWDHELQIANLQAPLSCAGQIPRHPIRL